MIGKAASKLFKKSANKESKIFKKKKKKSKKKSTKKKSVRGGAQKLAGKALLNPVTAGGAIGGTLAYGQGKAVERGRTNRLNEALRRRGVRV
jgi:hypothetical protein